MKEEYLNLKLELEYRIKILSEENEYLKKQIK